MIQLQFTPNEIDVLYLNLLRAEHHKTRLKSLVLYLKSQGMSHSEIQEICRISKPTLASYLKEFKSGGSDFFHVTKWKGQRSELNKYKEVIKLEFDSKPPRSAIEARDRIFKITGLKRSPTQVRTFMRDKLGYKFLKAGSLPGNGKDDDEIKESEREEFKKNGSNRCWMKQEKGKR